VDFQASARSRHPSVAVRGLGAVKRDRAGAAWSGPAAARRQSSWASSPASP